MPTEIHIAADPILPAPLPGPALLDVIAYSYEERRDVLPRLSEAMACCGCWLLDRRPISLTQMEIRFEVHLHSVVELYASLIASGLELTRGSHLDLTGLCTLRKHRVPAVNGSPSVVTVRLEVSFLEDLTLPSILATGTAFA